MNSRRLTLFLSLLFIAIFSLFISGCSRIGPVASSLKIAVIVPLSGEFSQIGEEERNGALLAIEDANANGGAFGRKFELVQMDDKDDPVESAIIAQKICADSSILGVVGGVNAGDTIPSAKIYAKNNVVMVTPSTTSTELTSKGYYSVFRICASDVLEGPYAANFIVSNLKFKRVAIIEDNSAYAKELTDSFKSEFLKLGGTVLIEEKISQGDKDFKAPLEKIKALNPQVVYFAGMYPECAQIIKEAKEMGIKSSFFGANGIKDTEFIKVAGIASEGTMATSVGFSLNKILKGPDFVQRYRNEFKKDPTDYSVFAYDATLSIIDAIKLAGNPDRATLANAMHNLKFDGILGSTSFDKEGNTTNNLINVYVVKNGNWVSFN
ncbi:branched-chain amino acid transport system substrate-binding protein [Thermodesulfobium acidiphilum]|uniref:Branched-chain amino acid transport system substrate-binding protein n=1 Tax=Thermodesulfobium acidiphilum TaxID=1794699 RepID=A0A2R4VYF6_THEAF|nr:branched-chain amino acid ABC transporter substrate-binding protein [Thermodesulfobium acidiphilum]AWB09508.1 branched-chain amino acid transport system substrate-binding protein [Thermodesulfobium acidiphilum]